MSIGQPAGTAFQWPIPECAWLEEEAALNALAQLQSTGVATESDSGRVATESFAPAERAVAEGLQGAAAAMSFGQVERKDVGAARFSSSGPALRGRDRRMGSRSFRP